MSTARFCEIIDMPERTWRRWQAKARTSRPPKGPRPGRADARELVVKHAAAHPAWGHRNVWVMTRHDGHRVSQATVLRLLRDESLVLPTDYQRERRKLANAQRLRSTRTEPIATTSGHPKRSPGTDPPMSTPGLAEPNIPTSKKK